MLTDMNIIIISLSVLAIAILLFLGIKKHYPRKKRGEANENKLITQTKTNAISTITEITDIIVKDSTGNELSLVKHDVNSLSEKRYREINIRASGSLGQVAQGALPVISHAQTVNEIAKAAPHGLYKATAPITDLMKYKDGTVSSIVLNDKIIDAHSGFEKVALNAVNPAAVIGAGMQAMAFISGQYFLHELSTQLKGIYKQLDKLVGYHHDEKLGILRSVNKGILERASKINVDISDIIANQQQKQDAEKVFYEYHTRLESINIDEIIGVKKRFINKPKEMQEISDNLDENEIELSLKMCYYASTLIEKSVLTEIAIRLKMGNQEQTIEELCKKLKSERDDCFHHCAGRLILDIYDPVLDKATELKEETDRRKNLPKVVLPFSVPALITSTITEIVKSTILSKQAEDNEAKLQDLSSRKDSLLQMTTTDTQIVDEIISFIEKPKEILYIANENQDEERLFVEEYNEIPDERQEGIE